MFCALLPFLTGCEILPASGPSAYGIHRKKVSGPGEMGNYRVVQLDEALVRDMARQSPWRSFTDAFGGWTPPPIPAGPGDHLEISIMEAPPGSLFGVGATVGTGAGTTQVVTFPDETVDRNGMIYFPFAGRVQASGRTLDQIQEDLAGRLKGKANQPQVMVRLVTNGSAYVTFISDTVNTRIPLTPQGERVLDVLAAGGGPHEDANRLTIRISRGGRVAVLPLETILRDSHQNIPLRAGDVMSVLHQPYSFTVLGAANRNDEIRFEGEGISLAQAIARSAGLNDSRANAQQVYVFRVDPDRSPSPAVGVESLRGKEPVIYTLDLRRPESVFVAQTFPIQDGDVLYVANSPSTGVQKFLGLIGTVFSPALNAAATGVNITNQAGLP